MSIQNEIDRIITAVQAAHEKVAEKGGTTAQPYLVANLASAIDSIPDASDPKLQEKTVTPKTSAQSVTPDSGYDGLSKVTVNAMPTATQATPSISVNSSGLITATATQSAGYVSAGTKSATKQLTTQAAKTITPSTSSQTAVAKGVYTTGAVTVAAIPSTYVKPTATKAATTYTPTTSNQTIAAGTYCSGAQTIKGDANLVAGNIKSGVSIFGVAGSYEGSGGGSGGGGSVETCTVTFDNSYSEGELPLVIVTTQIDGGADKVYTFFSEIDQYIHTVTIENVKCGTTIDLVFNNDMSDVNGIEIDGSASLVFEERMSNAVQRLHHLRFVAPQTAGENCTIYYYST